MISKLVRFEVLLLTLVACAFSVWAARQSGVIAYYIAASALALICVGTLGLPRTSALSASPSGANIRTWWAPAVLSLGVLVLVGVFVVRFILAPAA